MVDLPTSSYPDGQPAQGDVGRVAGGLIRGMDTAVERLRQQLLDISKRIEKHIKNSYLKRVDAPIGVKPRLCCWMELNEG